MDVSLINYNHTQLRKSLPYFTGFALLLQYFLEIPRIIEEEKKKQLLKTLLFNLVLENSWKFIDRKLHDELNCQLTQRDNVFGSPELQY